MNRQTKRMMQRQGQIEADGTAAVRRPAPPRPRPAEHRPNPVEFLREVRAELRKVAWPSRKEVANYSTVVLFTLVVLTSLIYLLNLAFAHGIIWLFQK